jgi:hypothetical protein
MQLVGQSQANYTYNPAEQLTEVQQGGLTAAVNLPAALSNNAYDVANQIMKWNGVTAGGPCPRRGYRRRSYR